MVEKSTKVQTPKPFGAIWVTSASQESRHKSERKRLSPRTPALCGLGRVKVMRAALAAVLGPKVRGGARSVPGWASGKGAGSLHAPQHYAGSAESR